MIIIISSSCCSHSLSPSVSPSFHLLSLLDWFLLQEFHRDIYVLIFEQPSSICDNPIPVAFSTPSIFALVECRIFLRFPHICLRFSTSLLPFFAWCSFQCLQNVFCSSRVLPSFHCICKRRYKMAVYNITFAPLDVYFFVLYVRIFQFFCITCWFENRWKESKTPVAKNSQISLYGTEIGRTASRQSYRIL